MSECAKKNKMQLDAFNEINFGGALMQLGTLKNDMQLAAYTKYREFSQWTHFCKYHQCVYSIHRVTQKK